MSPSHNTDRSHQNSIDPKGCLKKAFIAGGVGILFWLYGVKHPHSGDSFQPLLEPEAKFGQKQGDSILFSIEHPEELSSQQSKFLKSYAREFHKLLGTSSLAKEEQKIVTNGDVSIVFVSSGSKYLREGDFCSVNYEGKIFVDWTLIPNGPDKFQDRKMALSEEMAKILAQETWPVILDKIVQLSISFQLKNQLNLNSVYILRCQELLFSSALKTLAIVKDVDNKNNDSEADLLRQHFISNHAPYLSISNKALNSTDDDELSLSSDDIGDFSRETILLLDDIASFTLNPDNRETILQKISPEELDSLQKILSNPEVLVKIKSYLRKISAQSIGKFYFSKIEGECDEIMNGMQSDFMLGYSLDKLSNSIKKIEGIESLPPHLKEKLVKAGTVALPKVINQVTAENIDIEEKNSLIKQLSSAFKIGGKISEENRSLVENFLAREIQERERDPSWGAWQISERFDLEIQGIENIVDTINFVFDGDSKYEICERIEKLIKKMKEGIFRLNPDSIQDLKPDIMTA